ncbi:MAG: histidine kinase dimerization/phosphoacceptor domain-containing protein, partial [Pseudonocardia sp.]|nr:histidine kinase dimerization/phosphoacceptor domain-containing protein [Pseudonocardia sp.]
MRARCVTAVAQAELTRLTVQAAAAAADSELRMQNERQRISRDLHDTVGHTMAVISLQAGVAAEAVEPGNTAARDALERIREASGNTLRDLRALLNVLRSADGEGGAGADGV